MADVHVAGYPIAPVDRYTASRDPLEFDRILPKVCKLNAAADLDGVVGTLRSLVPTETAVAKLTVPDCAAAMRDLGILIGSIKRWGAEPVAAVPELGATLQLLGARTGMVPRDTILHYVGWNPSDTRERTYTGEPMERMLISSVRVTLPRVASAIEQCVRVGQLEPHQPEFATVVNELVALLRSLEGAIDIVNDEVIPQFFARTLRPFFEPVTVDGVEYLGPAAAHVPVYLVDLALWADGHDDLVYRKFCSHSAQYGLPHWQSAYSQWAGAPSIASRVATALTSAQSAERLSTVQASAAAVCRALRALIAFRGKHLTVARRAYAEDLRLYQVGSGGGSVELLSEISALTRANADSLREATGQGQRQGPRVRRSAT